METNVSGKSSVSLRRIGSERENKKKSIQFNSIILFNLTRESKENNHKIRRKKSTFYEN